MKKFLAILVTFFMLAIAVGCSSNTTTDTTTDTMDDTTEMTSEDLLVGEWEATTAPYKDDVLANIVMELKDDGTFTQDIFYLDKEENVESETPNLEISGTYKTEDDKIIFDNEKVVEGDKTYEGDEVADALGTDGTSDEYSYEVVDDTLTINASEGHVWDFVKL